MTDAEALRRTAAGEPDAYDRLVERHQAAVHRYIRVHERDPDRAEDALQETFISAWRAADTFRGDGSARAWLLGIARNAVRRQHRRRAGEPDHHEPLQALAAAAGWGDPIGPRVEARELVRKGFAALSDDDREILVLRDSEGFTGEEVAEMLQLSLPAVKSRLHRARLRFVAALKGVDEHAA